MWWHTIITKFPLLLQFHKTQCTRLYLHHLLVKMWDHVLSDILGSTAKHFYDLEKKQPPTPHTIIYCHAVTMCWVLATHVVSIRRVRVECSELEANDVSKQHQKMVSSACIKLLKAWECDIAMVERGQVQMYVSHTSYRPEYAVHHTYVMYLLPRHVVSQSCSLHQQDRHDREHS